MMKLMTAAALCDIAAATEPNFNCGVVPQVETAAPKGALADKEAPAEKQTVKPIVLPPTCSLDEVNTLMAQLEINIKQHRINVRMAKDAYPKGGKPMPYELELEGCLLKAEVDLVEKVEHVLEMYTLWPLTPPAEAKRYLAQRFRWINYVLGEMHIEQQKKLDKRFGPAGDFLENRSLVDLDLIAAEEAYNSAAAECERARKMGGFKAYKQAAEDWALEAKRTKMMKLGQLRTLQLGQEKLRKEIDELEQKTETTLNKMKLTVKKNALDENIKKYKETVKSLQDLESEGKVASKFPEQNYNAWWWIQIGLFAAFYCVFMVCLWQLMKFVKSKFGSGSAAGEAVAHNMMFGRGAYGSVE